MEICNKDIKHWVGLSLIPGIGHDKPTQTENYFKSLKKVWKAIAADLKRVGLDSNSIWTIVPYRSEFYLETEMELKGLVKYIGTMKFVLALEAREEYQVRVD